MCQFHTEWSHFSRQMVTIDYDGVSTHLMIILMIELGILVIRACANFLRSGDTFRGKWSGPVRSGLFFLVICTLLTQAENTF